ncbi:MAG: carbohydrate kinase [Bacilli bacterium]
MILCVGEILVDIFVDENKNETVFPGGAPFNVASNLTLFGNDVCFFGAIGKDRYGKLLCDFAKTKNFKKLEILQLDSYNTSKAIVTLTDGERDFKFDRDNGADYRLDFETFKKFDFSNINIVHLGSLMLSFKEGRELLIKMIDYLKNNTKCKISFDINYRSDIFSSLEESKKYYLSIIPSVDILKITTDELEILTGEKDIIKGLSSLVNKNIFTCLSDGGNGSYYFYQDKLEHIDTYKVKPVDTTGAGDAFYSYLLSSFDKKDYSLLSKEELKEIFTTANIVGGLTTLKKGAIDSCPTMTEIEKFKQNVRK